MADITMDLSQSALYLEVTNPQQIAQLRVQLIFQLNNRGEKVSPDEIGLKMTHDRRSVSRLPATPRVVEVLGRLCKHSVLRAAVPALSVPFCP